MPGPRSLLYLAHEYPVPISTPARLRTFNWLLHLSREFEVVLVAPAQQEVTEQDLDVLRGYCRNLVIVPSTESRNPVHRLTRALRTEALHWKTVHSSAAQSLEDDRFKRAVQQQMAHHRFDVCFSEHWTGSRLILQAAPYQVLDLDNTPVLQSEEDQHQPWQPWRRLGRERRRRLVSTERASLLSAVNLVLVNNPKSRHEVLQVTGGRARVLESAAGLNTTYFSPWSGTMDPRKIVFFSSLESPTQRDALLHFHRNLLPRIRQRLGNVRLTVVAPECSPELQAILLQDSNVRYSGPQADVRSELGRSAVAVLPLRIGAGSPSRLAQLLAMGIPTVATPIASHSLGVESGEGLLVARDGDEFVRSVVQVLKDWSLRLDLSQRGREIAETRLSLQATYERLSTLLAKTVS